MQLRILCNCERGYNRAFKCHTGGTKCQINYKRQRKCLIILPKFSPEHSERWWNNQLYNHKCEAKYDFAISEAIPHKKVYHQCYLVHMRDCPRIKSAKYGSYSIRGSSFMKNHPHIWHTCIWTHKYVFICKYNLRLGTYTSTITISILPYGFSHGMENDFLFFSKTIKFSRSFQVDVLNRLTSLIDEREELHMGKPSSITWQNVIRVLMQLSVL